MFTPLLSSLQPNDIWVGVELDEARGKNDGEVKNVRYFACPPSHGLFARAEKLSPAEYPLEDAARTAQLLRAALTHAQNALDEALAQAEDDRAKCEAQAVALAALKDALKRNGADAQPQDNEDSEAAAADDRGGEEKGAAGPGEEGGEGAEARAGFAAKGVAVFDSVLHFRKDFYKATPVGKTAIELDPESKAAAELRAAFVEAKRLSGYANKPLSEVA